MKYIKAASDMANDIQNVLHMAIKTIYPKYYPIEAIKRWGMEYTNWKMM